MRFSFARTVHSISDHYANDQNKPQILDVIASDDGERSMYRPAKPLEELALDLAFESFGENRYNRTAADYERLSALVSNLQDVHFRVNTELAKIKKSGKPRWNSICYFKAGDLTPRYASFPESISVETIRSALTYSGLRKPKWKKRAT